MRTKPAGSNQGDSCTILHINGRSLTKAADNGHHFPSHNSILFARKRQRFLKKVGISTCSLGPRGKMMKTMKPSSSSGNAGKMDKSKLPYIRRIRLATGEYITRNFPSPQVFQTVFIDFMANIPPTTEGNSCALIMMDQLSRFSIAEPLQTTASEDMLEMIRNELIFHWPQPKYFVCDISPHFKCSAFKEFCKLYDIEISFTTPQDRISGVVREGEKCFKTTKKMLQNLMTADEKHWDEHLKSACFRYNTAVNDSTGYTPFYYARGFEARKGGSQEDRATEVVPEAGGDEWIKNTREMLKSFMTTDEDLQAAVFRYNTTVNPDTGYTPYYLVHGFEAPNPPK